MAEKRRWQNTKAEVARNALTRQIRNEVHDQTVVPLQAEMSAVIEKWRLKFVASDSSCAELQAALEAAVAVRSSDQARFQRNIEAERVENGKLMIAAAEKDRRIEYLEKLHANAVERIDELHRQNRSLEDRAVQWQKAAAVQAARVDGRPPSDTVAHPSYYNTGKFEVIEVIHDWKLGFDLGNAVKYIARAGRKDPAKTIEDLKKAIFYINDEIKRLEAK